jgi:16S rRNA (adenine1518-N6/adenine1519-N6)-dimethyltransferase
MPNKGKGKILKAPRAKKSLGQHFLTNQSVIDGICEDVLEGMDKVLEVGPGPAVLSSTLVNMDISYQCIEKDQGFKEYLLKCMPETSIIWGDALEVPLETVLGKKTWLVSNLPYNVSVPLTLRFLQEPRVAKMTLMYQKEVAEKIVPPVKNGKIQKNHMNSLYCLTHTYFSCEKLLDVSKDSFMPPPKVESMVVSFVRREEYVVPLGEMKCFEKFLRLLFKFKRKTIKKCLTSSLDKDMVKKLLESMNIAENVRAETLSLDCVQKLYASYVLLEKSAK